MRNITFRSYLMGILKVKTLIWQENTFTKTIWAWVGNLHFAIHLFLSTSLFLCSGRKDIIKVYVNSFTLWIGKPSLISFKTLYFELLLFNSVLPRIKARALHTRDKLILYLLKSCKNTTHIPCIPQTYFPEH
jgi:hypothetical protein